MEATDKKSTIFYEDIGEKITEINLDDDWSINFFQYDNNRTRINFEKKGNLK